MVLELPLKNMSKAMWFAAISLSLSLSRFVRRFRMLLLTKHVFLQDEHIKIAG